MQLLKKLSALFEIENIVKLNEHLHYDFKTRELKVNDDVLNLTKKEILFIELLTLNRNDIITEEMIQCNVWENKVMSDAALKNFILRLRKKVEIDFLLTVQGVGYKLQ